MATRKAKKKIPKAAEEVMPMTMPVMEGKREEKKTNEWGGEPLDPKEEKMLDMILKGIVIFILGWLGLGILLSIKGLIWPG